MPTQRRAVWLMAALALLAVPLATSAQTPAPGPAAQTPPYRLGFGDMMIFGVQPRHAKLWFAAQAKNWELADWNRDELDETFRRLGRLYPMVEKMDIQPGLAMVKDPMDQLKKAIDDKDSKAFTAAYTQLTAACNACHMQYKNPMISIKVPTGAASMFPDQDFAPPKAAAPGKKK